MSRQTIEFFCTECKKYFDIRLNLSLNGNYRIHCPLCKHIHYRVVEDGKITDARFGQSNSVLIEDIVPMPSSCRDTQKETVLDSEVNPDAKGFLHRLWKRKELVH